MVCVSIFSLSRALRSAHITLECYLIDPRILFYLKLYLASFSFVCQELDSPKSPASLLKASMPRPPAPASTALHPKSTVFLRNGIVSSYTLPNACQISASRGGIASTCEDVSRGALGPKSATRPKKLRDKTKIIKRRWSDLSHSEAKSTAFFSLFVVATKNTSSSCTQWLRVTLASTSLSRRRSVSAFPMAMASSTKESRSSETTPRKIKSDKKGALTHAKESAGVFSHRGASWRRMTERLRSCMRHAASSSPCA